MVKSNALIIALASAIILTSQQMMLWNSWFLVTDRGDDEPSLSLDRPSNDDKRVQRRQSSAMEHRADRLTEPPTNIYVLGERNSGTTFTAGVLKKSFDPPNNPDGTRQHEVFSSDIPVLLHKHMFRHHLLNETELEMISMRTDILWLFAVRSPCEWAEAMKRIPWHMCHPKNIENCPNNKFVGFERKELMKQYTLEEFFQLPWGDWPESRNFRNLSFVSDEYTYRNVFELRRHKLMIMEQIIETVPRNVKIVRLHELERSPEIFIQNLVQEFQLKLKSGYKTQEPSAKIHTEKCLSRQEWAIAQREIDWRVENKFGYTSLDCHMCYE